MTSRGILVGAVVGLISMLAACSGGGSESDPTARTEDKPVVQAVNYPLMYFAERLGGDAIEVRFRAPGDGDPAFWTPEPADVTALQSADLVLLNGADYAKWRAFVSLSPGKTVDTGAAFRSDLIEVVGGATHSHGGDGDHSHGGVAFTTWLDMSQARRQVEAVRDALARLTPEAAEDIASRAEALLADLDRLDGDLRRVATEIGDAPLVASHPVYQYLARRYGLAIESVLWEPETVPDDAAMTELSSILAEHEAAWMIWEGDPVAESVAKLDAIGVESIVFDPCGNRPEVGDWLTVMSANVKNLERIGG